MDPSSEKTRRLLRRQQQLANRPGRRHPGVMIRGTRNKRGEFACIGNREHERIMKAAYNREVTDSYYFQPLSKRLATWQMELESSGESHKLSLAPALQKQVDEARKAMLPNNPNHPAAAAASTGDLGNPIETLVENLNLEASSSTGTRTEVKAVSSVSHEPMDLNPAVTGTRAQVKVASILNCPFEVFGKVNMVENLNRTAPGSSAAIGGY